MNSDKGEDIMPLYEYTCKSCNHAFEALHSIKDIEKKEKCPKCGQPAEKKKFSIFGRIAPSSCSGSGGFT
jgi:putative FmdB family regulatory protein